jgi:hypothetical protein
VFQLPFVKVRLDETVPSLESELLRAIVTLSDGCVSSTTVNSAVSPASVVTRSLVGVTVIPASIAPELRPEKASIATTSKQVINRFLILILLLKIREFLINKA